MIHADVLRNVVRKQILVRFGPAADVDQASFEIGRRRAPQRAIVNCVNQQILEIAHRVKTWMQLRRQ